MSQSEVERFTRAVKADAKLRAEVEKTTGLAAAVALANRHGFGFTAEDVTAGRALSEKDLEAASGGANLPLPGFDPTKGWDPNLAPWGDKSKL